MFRIFSKERRVLTTDIDTWIVRWTTYQYSFTGVKYTNIKECYQAFTNYDEAVEFKDALNDAMKFLHITALPSAEVFKQKRNSL
jgi:hypothetical protein